MMNNICVLFDLDGVLIDSESQYDIFWRKTEEEYHLGIAHFEKKIKGTTLPNILVQYFSHLPLEERNDIARRNREFELAMDYEEIPGATAFLRALKDKGIKTGLVTSSDDTKLKVVFRRMQFDGLFDTVVSANRITQGKPHPMCYLLAAEEVKVRPSDCFVFEDSFAGIQSGTDAGMKVIGLSTTHPASAIQDKVIKVIPDFRNFTPDDL